MYCLVLISFFLILTTCSVNGVYFRSSVSSEVVLPQGSLVGYGHGSYIKYLGIPYATVIERFKAPGPPPSWPGTLHATNNFIKCNQFSSTLNNPVGQKHCLHLNVYTPVNMTVQYPVMVFIHGGGFYWGSGTDLIYNPKYLVQKGVIVVTINYRLGAFGFLCLKNAGAPGNAGLKDQIAALRWVKDNINYFGGDADTVTVFGQSAGAASVNYLLLSDSARGLFNKAIMQSGSVLMPLAFQVDPIKQASMVAAKMGYFTNDNHKLLEIFRKASIEDIVKATHVDDENSAYGPYVFGPCAETEMTADAVITMSPEDLLGSHKLDPKLKLMIGYNNKEGIYYASRYNDLEIVDKNLTNAIPINLRHTRNHQRHLVEDIKRFYFKNEPVTYDRLIDYFSDTIVIYPSTIVTEAFLANSNIPVYNYFFKYSSIRNFSKFLARFFMTPGAAHGDELYYIFDPIMYQWLPPSSTDAHFIDVMTTMWTDFAKIGNPNAHHAVRNSIAWNKSNQDQLKFLELGNDKIRMINLPNKKRIEFWKNVYDNNNR